MKISFYKLSVQDSSLVRSANTFVTQLANLIKISHIQAYMHEFYIKNKLRILLSPFFTVFPILGIAVLWNSFIPRSGENVKVDTNVVQAKSDPLEESKSRNEIDQKKQELEKLTEENLELDAILKEKEEIYNRLVELQDQPWTYEVAQLQNRNEELNQIIISKYPELWGDE